jgi:hypothetical protein
MKGTVDATYLTVQRDLFDSGLVAVIGVNSFAVWNAIKCHADFNTGLCYPGMRSLGQKVGLSTASVQRAVARLLDHHMLRIVSPHGKTKGQTYIARERLDVRVGGVVVCTVVMDYIPAKIRSVAKAVKSDLEQGKNDSFSLVEIIPGKGFEYDSVDGRFKKEVKAGEVRRSAAEFLKNLKGEK